MNPNDFFEAFVQGNFEDYQLNIGSVRLAFNASISASHMADHYYWYCKKYNPTKVMSFINHNDFIEYISQNTNHCFRDIRSISNAYKHLYTSVDPRKAVHITISSAGAIESISFPDKKSDLNKIEEQLSSDTNIDNQNTKVVFTRKDGQKIEFLPTLKTVIEFWGKLLN